MFGDLTPVTAQLRTPTGFKVVRVDVSSGTVSDFAVSKMQGPASRLPHRGFERPSHCQFGPEGGLYVVDWGEISIAPEKGGVRMQRGTGVLWRIRRTDEPIGDEPASPVEVPSYAAKFGVGVALAGVMGWRLARRRSGAHRRRG